MEPSVVSNVAVSSRNRRLEEYSGMLGAVISWWTLREHFEKTDWLRRMGSGASEHKH